MASDSPRYRTVQIRSADASRGFDPAALDLSLARALRPGDKIVSVFTLGKDVWGSDRVCALIELRHPSWEEANVGFTAQGSGGDQ